MTRQVDAKRERVIEAVRRGLEGDEALAFIHQSGYAMTPAGIARHLRALGGRRAVEERIEAGQSNETILAESQDDPDSKSKPAAAEPADSPPKLNEEELFPTRKLTMRISSELYEAIRLAAKARDMSQHELIIDVLTRGLSRMPEPESDGR